MAKKNQIKLLTTIVLVSLLSYSICAVLAPNANAAEITLQQKGLAVLSDVMNIDLTEYATSSQEYPTDFYLDVIPQANMRYRLESNTSKVDVLCTFANEKLRMIQVLETEGKLSMTKSTGSELEMVKNFLSNHQSFTGNSFYGELRSMLANAEAGKSFVATSGNIKLEVVASHSDATFRWTYTFNGIEAPTKCVALRYKEGFLKYFIDNWDLHKIGSTTINISEKEALDIAKGQAKTFSWKVGSDDNTFEVKNFNVTQAIIWQTAFYSNLDADEPRSQDPLMLYPVRHVWVSLDKFYPGNVYGIEVYVWADTGKIGHIQERFSTMLPSDAKIASLSESAVPLNAQTPEISLNSLSIVPPVFALIVLGTVSTWLLKKKSLPKHQSFKIGGLILCILIASTMFVSTVSADPRRRFTVWGSESTGMAGRKTQSEIAQQRQTSQWISDYFKNDGYFSSNYQGTGSTKSSILYNIWYNERNYDRVAVLDFDHGVGRFDYPSDNGNFHYMFEDNIGKTGEPPNYDHLVFDMDVDDQKIGKTFLIFINTCMSANLTYQSDNGGNIQGMPHAWTGHQVSSNPGSEEMSDDAYNEPDTGAFCYLGFSWGSAALDQTITAGYPKYHLWIEGFFYYGLSFEETVIQALNHASNNRFGEDFDETDLFDEDGFTSIWPMDTDGDGNWENTYGYNSHLEVYGNGNIRFYEYFVHSPYVTYGTYGSGQVSNPNGFTGAQPDYSATRLRAINVGDQANIVGSMGYSGANLANGHIWVNGQSASGYTSRLRVYVSYYSGSGWQHVTDAIISPGAMHWIDCGTWSSNFRYISFAVYRESANDYSNDVYLNTVVVLPPLPDP